MKCLIEGCGADAQPGWPCCSTLHGKMLRVAREALLQVSSTGTRKDGLSTWRWYFEGQPTVADALAYLGK